MTRRRLSVLQLAVIALAVFSLFGCREGHRYHSPTGPPDVIIGSGKVVRETRPISGVNGIKLVGVGNIQLTQAGSEGLVVEAEDNILPYLTTEVIGGTLVISQSHTASLQTTRRIVYYVDVLSIDNVELVGTGNFECDSLTGNRLTVRTIGVGDIDFSGLELDELEVTVAGV